MPKLASFMEGSTPVHFLPAPELPLLPMHLSHVKGYPVCEAYMDNNYDIIYEEVVTDKGGLSNITVYVEKQTTLTLSLRKHAYALILLTRGSIVTDFNDDRSDLLFQWQLLGFGSDDTLKLLLLPGYYEMKIIQINNVACAVQPFPAPKNSLWSNRPLSNTWPYNPQIALIPEVLTNEIRNIEKDKLAETTYHSWFTGKFIPIVQSYIQLKLLMPEYKKPWPLNRLEIITTYINQNLAAQITDSDLCTTYYLTETELEKFFFDHYQCSVRRYITDQRLAKANELLAYESLGIAEIAAMVGYKVVHRFISDFQNHYGTLYHHQEKRKF